MATKRIRQGLLGGLLALLHAGTAGAGIHTWDVNEVFSNADGTIQFVELWEANGTSGETGVGNGTVSTDAHTFNMSEGAVAQPTTNKFFLLGTAEFAALPDAPTPDAIIPAGFIPFFFDPTGDTVAFGGFDSWSIAAVPTNGVDSLDRLDGVGVNTPTNYAGDTATIDVSPPPAIPLAPLPLLALSAALLGGAGAGTLLWRRRSAS